MIIEVKKFKDVNRAPYNPRVELKAGMLEYEKLKKSIVTFGHVLPMVFNKRSDNLVGGHQTMTVLEDLGKTEAEMSIVDLSEVEEKALNIGLNKISGEWDNSKLIEILNELIEIPEFDIDLTGFDLDELDLMDGLSTEGMGGSDNQEVGSLKDRFIVPPFTVLDTRQGYWVDRKRVWKSIILDDGDSRGGAHAFTANDLTEIGVKIKNIKAVSILDPVLAEVLGCWFNTDNGSVLDCFAGDTVFGFVAGYNKHKFTGIELRQEQADFNSARCNAFDLPCEYICDDGQNVSDHVPEKSIDLLFSCPPYYDLEVYSDLPNDASNQGTYDEFMVIINTAFTNALKCLKDDRFAVIVVGDIRDKKGAYYNYPGDIRKMFMDQGLILYNDLILVEAIGTLPYRAAKAMVNRKVGKCHQNILVFYKGNPSNIKKNYPELQLGDIADISGGLE